MTIECPYCMAAQAAPPALINDIGRLVMICFCGEFYRVEMQMTGRKLTDEERHEIETSDEWAQLDARQKEIRNLYKAGTN